MKILLQVAAIVLVPIAQNVIVRLLICCSGLRTIKGIGVHEVRYLVIISSYLVISGLLTFSCKLNSLSSRETPVLYPILDFFCVFLILRSMGVIMEHFYRSLGRRFIAFGI